MQIQHYLQSCSHFLQSPDDMEPMELAQYIVGNWRLGVNDHITSMVQRYFYLNLNLNHPELSRYIQLLDRLLHFNFPLPNSLVDMYAQCFRLSLEFGRKSIQEELKILRKIWTPILDAQCIEAFRLEVYRLTQIDIQMELRDESRKFLFQYFRKAKLDCQQINEILKKKPPIRMPVYNRPALNPISPGNSWNDSRDQPRFRNRKNPPIFEQFIHKFHPHHPHPQPKFHLPPQPPVSPHEICLSHKKILLNLQPHSCLQCGQHFTNPCSLISHKEGHFQQRMQNYKEARRQDLLKNQKNMKNMKKSKSKELNVSQWIGNQNQEKLRTTNVRLSGGAEQEGQEQKEKEKHQVREICGFCGEKFGVMIVDDSFVYRDVVKVKVQQARKVSRDPIQDKSQYDLMHSWCYSAIICPESPTPNNPTPTTPTTSSTPNPTTPNNNNGNGNSNSNSGYANYGNGNDKIIL